MPGVLMSVWGLWAYALGHLTVGGTSSTDLIAGAAFAAAGLLAVAISAHLAVGLLAGRAHRPARLARVAVRERARRARLPRLLDPDAAGRPRPRAPSAYLPAA